MALLLVMDDGRMLQQLRAVMLALAAPAWHAFNHALCTPQTQRASSCLTVSDDWLMMVDDGRYDHRRPFTPGGAVNIYTTTVLSQQYASILHT